jgi:hypothetical protein
MPKEWILNQAMMRFQLNRPKHVGHVAEEIRKCRPKSVEEWEDYYYQKVRSKEQLEIIGKMLYDKITKVCRAEIESITEEDCINFVKELVIKRTYDGYQSEIQTIYGQLEKALGVKIEPASDEWDRLYNVDFFIKVGKRYIGIQVCPAGFPYITEIIKEIEIAKETHKKFSEKYGGKVFYVLSVEKGGKKTIHNTEVIEEIKREIQKLSESY